MISNEDGNVDTVILQTDEYFQDINYPFGIKTDKDIKEWMKIVADFYYKFAKPFYAKYNSVSDIDTLLNSTPSKRVPELNDLGAHIITGLISAKLNHDHNPNYEELRDYYKNEVEEKFRGHFLYENCMKVIEFLDSYSYEELNELS